MSQPVRIIPNVIYGEVGSFLDARGLASLARVSKAARPGVELARQKISELHVHLNDPQTPAPSVYRESRFVASPKCERDLKGALRPHLRVRYKDGIPSLKKFSLYSRGVYAIDTSVVMKYLVPFLRANPLRELKLSLLMYTPKFRMTRWPVDVVWQHVIDAINPSRLEHLCLRDRNDTNNGVLERNSCAREIFLRKIRSCNQLKSLELRMQDRPPFSATVLDAIPKERFAHLSLFVSPFLVDNTSYIPILMQFNPRSIQSCHLCFDGPDMGQMLAFLRFLPFSKMRQVDLMIQHVIVLNLMRAIVQGFQAAPNLVIEKFSLVMPTAVGTQEMGDLASTLLDSILSPHLESFRLFIKHEVGDRVFGRNLDIPTWQRRLAQWPRLVKMDINNSFGWDLQEIRGALI
jgi:hypothetical protein